MLEDLQLLLPLDNDALSLCGYLFKSQDNDDSNYVHGVNCNFKSLFYVIGEKNGLNLKDLSYE